MSGRRLAAAAFGWTAVGMLVFGAVAAHASVDDPVRAGDAVIVEPSHVDHPIARGASATLFSVRLPDGAACPGDSEHDQWRVQSFIAPIDDDPATFTYNVIAPDGEGRYALYLQTTRPFINMVTQSNSTVGAPGQIGGVPSMSFAVFPPGTLPAGRYRIGIACTLFHETAKYWDSELDITETPSDQPGQLTWVAPNAPADGSKADDSSTSWLPIAAAGVLALLAVAWAVRARRAGLQLRSKGPQ